MAKFRAQTFLMLVLVGGCAHRDHRAAPKRPLQATRATPTELAPHSEKLSFSALGADWAVELGEDLPKGLAFAQLRDKIFSAAAEIERVFSDTLPDSELRRLERAGLTRVQRPSPLFWEVLNYARETSALTEGSFDVTIGAVRWKSLAAPVGMQELELRDGTFRFKRDPKRLSFGGLTLGAAVGKISLVLRGYQIRNFRVAAGDAALAVAGTNFDAPWSEPSFGRNEILFMARSRSKKDGEQKVFDPSAPTRQLERKSEVACTEAFALPTKWFRSAILTDALSTAALVKPDFQNVPPNCRIKVSQQAP